KQGGSTITQQLAKGLMLTPERTIMRKIREMILAFKMESYLTKDQILEIYLNQIFLGHNAYGIRGAANAYYGKEPKDLSLAQAATLAGLTRAPSRDNPIASLERADGKRKYVLGRMLEESYITKSQYEQALDESIQPLEDENLNFKYAPYFVEHVRKYLVQKYGDDLILEGGLRIYTTVDSNAAKAAEIALRRGIEDVDHHQGYYGPITKIKKKDRKDYPSVLMTEQDSKKLERDRFYKALVTDVDNKKKLVLIHLGHREGFIVFDDMKWARRPNPEVYWEYGLIQKPSDALSEGDVIWVRLPRDKENSKPIKNAPKGRVRFVLTQEPKVQGALLAMDPSNGEIRAVVGGYDFNKSEFNRAVQASRQPGSAFKPIIYTAALDHGYTPASVVLDIPVVYDDPGQDFIWKPKNYAGEFHGDTIFRDCLVQSRNVPTIKIVENIGLDTVISYAERLGIRSPLQRNLSLALGSSSVTLLELTSAYSVFAAGGRRRDQEIFVSKVLDREDQILERNSYHDLSMDLIAQTIVAEKQVLSELQHKEAIEAGKVVKVDPEDPNQPEIVPTPEISLPSDYAISPQTAFIMTHLLKQVISAGTARRVYDAKRPAAGKTGTTNENHDAWFMGFTPDLVAGVWIGHDDASKSLGTMEDGGRVASPIWQAFMTEALVNEPRDFEIPEGVIAVPIDRESGKRTELKDNNTLEEYFKVGTEPLLNDPEKSIDKKSVQDFYLEE
ncbi:MAG: PBP1A family penicillin-binding protein, partial [Bdellovibrionales bacterium]|nr:PBP1A family penicillin-binding protein [Bdellovibrionales bacterium]